MNDALVERLERLLGDRFERPDGAGEGARLTVLPRDADELSAIIRAVGEAGQSVRDTLTIDRRHFARIDEVDRRSALVEVGAGVPLAEIEQRAAWSELTLGPLGPVLQHGTVADLLEGPPAGLRVVPGGRLEPVCLSLTALLPEGLVWSSRRSPRRAAGPDLLHLLLGGEGRFGLVLEATLRLHPRPTTRSTVTVAFAEPSRLTGALIRSVAEGACLEGARLARVGARFVAELTLAGSVESVDRDLATVNALVHEAGGRSLDQPLSGFPRVDGDGEGRSPATSSGPGARELGWGELSARLRDGGASTLTRIACASALLITDGREGSEGLHSKTRGWPDGELWERIGRAVDIKDAWGAA